MVFDKIRSFLAEQLEIDEDKITVDTDIVGDLGADSLDVVELIMAAEGEFGLVIPDEAVVEFHTVGDVVAYIEKSLDK